jgi:transcriptional regulator with XRE-family HTH domain
MPDRTQDFATELRVLRAARGLSVRELAARTFFSKSYIGMLENGDRPATAEVARRLDDALEAHGALIRLVTGTRPVLTTVEVANGRTQAGLDEPMGAEDVEHLRDTVHHLVALDTAHGSNGLHVSAIRAFETAQARLSRVGVRDKDRADVHAALAEVGEVAAWLAYDSEHQDDSRRVATEAMLVAQTAGDTSMVRFIISHLSMQATYLDRGAEGLALADRVIAEQPRSKRVVGLMRVRRARALARIGDGQRALAELELARRELAGGIGPDDPGWTWWLHTAELAVHEYRIRSLAGDGTGAVTWSENAVLALPSKQGRDQALYRAWLVSDLVDVGAWREADEVVEQLLGKVVAGSSARVPRILRNAERRARRAEAPSWLADSLHEAIETSSRSA